MVVWRSREDCEMLVIAFWAFLFPISSIPPAAAPSPLLSDAFNSTGGWTYRFFVVCMFPCMKAGLSKPRHHRQQKHTWLLLSGLLIYCCGGENAKSMQKPKLSYLCHAHNFCAMGTANIIAVAVCAIALGIGTCTLHDKYSPVTCSRCAVIENMICSCTENRWSPTCLWDSLVCFYCVVHVHRCRKSVIPHLAQFTGASNLVMYSP